MKKLLLLLLAVGLVGCTTDQPEQRTPRHVLLITVDTLRADHLGFYGYERDTSPNLDALAESSVVYERAFAQWPKTGTSFASMFTGQYPQSTGLTHKAALRVPDAYLTLPEIFQDNGFTTFAVVSNAVLAKRLGWDTGFMDYRQTWDLAPEVSDVPEIYRKTIQAGIVNDLAAELLQANRDAERLFGWIHYSDPHAPYLLPDGEENPFLGDPYDVGDGVVKLHAPRGSALGDRRETRYYVAQYDANIRYTDRAIGDLLGFTRELGLLEDTLIIFTADHGESLGEHGYYCGHGRLPHNPGIHVPLLFSYPPGVPGGRRIERPVELVDLYATLQEWLFPEMPMPDLEGENLLPELLAQESAEPATSANNLAFSQAGGGDPLTHFRIVQDEEWKLVYHPAMGEEPVRWELFDLRVDPGEENNLFESEDPEAEKARNRLQRALSGWMNGTDWIVRERDEIEAQSEETLKVLRALGYVQN